MPRDSVYEALGRRTDAKYRQATGLDLRAPSVGYHLGRDADLSCCRLERLQLFLALCLDRDLGLPISLPATEQTRLSRAGAFLRGGAGQSLVAGEGRV